MSDLGTLRLEMFILLLKEIFLVESWKALNQILATFPNSLFTECTSLSGGVNVKSQFVEYPLTDEWECLNVLTANV